MEIDVSVKSAPNDFAILGGTPVFPEKLHVGRPNILNKAALLTRINQMLERCWLTNNGPLVQEFEQKITDITGVKHCIAMCNGTIALEIVIRALGMTGEVIVPSATFIATAHSLQWQGVTPIFSDIDIHTHNLDTAKIERMITPRTTGIIGVHLWGRPCDIEALTDVANRHGLKLIFDAAHAFGCTYKGKMIGNFGNAEVYSFHATKFINTFEGGAVVTNDDHLAQKIRLMKNFGFAGYDNVIYIGTNGKMSEISAAMGLTSVESMDEIISANRTNYHLYQHLLEAIPGISLISYNKKERMNYQYIIIEVDEKAAGIARNRIVEILHAENIIARRYFFPGCHKMEPYRSYFPHAGLLLPETEKLLDRVISLPTGTAITEEHIRKICATLSAIIHHSGSLRERA
ncbi:MAG: DegT/DnrJ/EryC1/StrS family aminotransferase [Thermodesulfobacteriota bacterium]